MLQVPDVNGVYDGVTRSNWFLSYDYSLLRIETMMELRALVREDTMLDLGTDLHNTR